MNRAGAAIPLVMVLLVVALPIAAALFVRSSQSVNWAAKLQSRDVAGALAEEGERDALDSLRAGGGAAAGARPTSEGTMSWAVYTMPPGAAGQVQYFVVAEGLHLGEERLLVEIAEVTGPVTATYVIPHDRAWQPADPSGAPLDPTALRTAHVARVDRYVTRLRQEQPLTDVVFQDRLQETLGTRDTSALPAAWPPLATELTAVKVQPAPPGTLAQLATSYQTLYAAYRAQLAANQPAAAEVKHRAFVQALRQYQLKAP